MNIVIYTVNSFPFAQTTPLALKVLEVWLIYLILFLIIQFLIKKKISYLRLVAFSIFVLSSISVYNQFINVSSNKVAVHQINNHTCLSIIYNNKAFILTDSILFNDRPKIDYHLKEYLLYNGISDYQLNKIGKLDTFPFPFREENNTISFTIEGKSICLASNNLANLNLPASDLLIINNNAINCISQLEEVKSKLFVFDGSNSNYKTNSLLNQLKKSANHIKFTRNTGAFIMNL